MSLLGNLLWLLGGGLFMAFLYFAGALVLMVTIIGIPFGLQVFKLGILALWPFNSKVIPTSTNRGCLPVAFNVLWIITGGIWITLLHLFLGIIFFITIIGIPFGRQHFKLAWLALTPFGYKIV